MDAPLVSCGDVAETWKCYGNSWWREGEVIIFLDGDVALPTLVGAGAEIISVLLGQATDHQYQGALIADGEKFEQAFYRYHIPDPIYFYGDIRVTIQQMGGWPTEKVRELVASGAELEPVTVSVGDKLVKLLEMENHPLYRMRISPSAGPTSGEMMMSLRQLIFT